jgi:hypothetical protein
MPFRACICGPPHPGKITLALIGLDNAGKSSLLNVLDGKPGQGTRPTCGLGACVSIQLPLRSGLTQAGAPQPGLRQPRCQARCVPLCPAPGSFPAAH